MVETKGHPHAHLMKLYAEDAMTHPEPWTLWQVRGHGDTEWVILKEQPLWHVKCEYRSKTRTIRIGNRDAPEPMRTAPKLNAVYFVPSPDLDKLYYSTAWDYSKPDEYRLKRNMCHLTREAAIEHAKALIEASGGTV